MKAFSTKYVWSIIIISVVALWLSQQTYADSKADGILSKVSSNLTANKAIEISFEIGNGEAKNPGTLIMSGRCFKMSTRGVTIWFDGRTQWTYIAQNKEMNITEPTASEIEETNPLELIRNHGAKFTGRVTASKSTYDIIELTPKDKDSQIKNINVAVNRNNYRLKYLEIKFDNGTSNFITIKSQTELNAVAPSVFAFDKKQYPNIEIIDLR